MLQRMDNHPDQKLREKLLTWFDREQRPMPWREDPSPYKVWISEIMLQQTQVATVIPYFERFVDRFPGTRELAAAEEEHVLATWSGLGYYRRARNLWKAARLIEDELGGEIPNGTKALEALPGVGKYTAGAIASIAFGISAPAVDGNQIRVLTRLWALSGDSTRNPLKAEIWIRAGELVDCDRPGDLNQALMELGARICKPRSPRCEDCPLAMSCRAFAEDRSEEFPHRDPADRPRPVKVEVGIFLRGSRVLLSRGDRPFLGDLWNLPYRVRDGGGFHAEDWKQLGLEAPDLRLLGEHRMSITRYRIAQETVTGDVELLVGENLPEYRWFRHSELKTLGLPAFSKKLINRYMSGEGKK
jgi:A/G-specific adenine glycosylase